LEKPTAPGTAFPTFLPAVEIYEPYHPEEFFLKSLIINLLSNLYVTIMISTPVACVVYVYIGFTRWFIPLGRPLQGLSFERLNLFGLKELVSIIF